MKYFFTALLILAGSLRADSARPDEGDMFGSAAAASTSLDSSGTSDASTSSAQANSVQASGVLSGDKDSQELSQANPQRDAFASGETKDNPLEIGGIIYQQAIATEQKDASAASAALSLPLQVDTFLDARPNDRIRGYLDARLIYDSSKDSYSHSTAGGSSFAGLPTASGTTPTAAVANNPQVVLDQAWLKFDIEHAVFVTAGKQHLKWGASHTWNPTDFLTPQHLDPLQPYDLRLGANMLKLEAPLGAAKTNITAVALLDNPEPASTLGQIGGAFRVETTAIGSAEIGLDAVTRAGMNPDYGADISMPLGPFDVYGEAAMLTGQNFSTLVRNSSPLGGSPQLDSLFDTENFGGPAVQTSAGLSYDFAWEANRQATVGAEYFYNELGSDSAKVYPILIYQGKYQPFYMGKNYASIYITAEGPDEAKNTSYSFSTISNISDGSFVSRLDFSWLLLDYLSFGAYGDLHYGTEGGEFNFALNTPELQNGSNTIPAVNLAATPYDLGLSLRISY